MPLFALTYALPNINTILTEVGSSSGPVITEFLPLVWFLGGLALAGGIVFYLIRALRSLI